MRRVGVVTLEDTSKAILRPKDAPRLPPDHQRAPVSAPVAHVAANYSRYMLPALIAAVFMPGRALRAALPDVRITYLKLLRYLLDALVPILLTAVTLGAI